MLRLIDAIYSKTPGTDATVKVYFDTVDKEYQAHLYQHGRHYKPADYFTTDLDDCQATAQAMCDREAASQLQANQAIAAIEAESQDLGVPRHDQ